MFIQETLTPELFGISGSNKSNKDFSQAAAWGKNSFNNCFPTALLCYMHSQAIPPVYLVMDKNLNVIHQQIGVSDAFAMEADSESIFFSFEDTFAHNQRFVIGTLPRIDLVIMDTSSSSAPVRGLEIKLTALPDNSTCDFSDNEYSCELVVRPNTIVHLALSIISKYASQSQDVFDILHPVCVQVTDWENEDILLEMMSDFTGLIDEILLLHLDYQEPLVAQIVWKTEGKSVRLNDNCLDAFLWSTFAFTRLFIDGARQGTNTFSRSMRSVVWLVRMLYDFSKDGEVNYRQVLGASSSNQSDKAFALSGRKTHPYLRCKELSAPRVKKEEIKNIILGGGEKLLSPERRFDAIIANSPELF